jgi:hypothetical protein
MKLNIEQACFAKKQTTGFTVFLLSTLLLLSTKVAGQAPVFSDGFEPLPARPLNCELKAYPCSMADADPEARQRVATLLREIWDVRHQGNMDDVRAYLESQADVLEVGGSGRFVSFRVEGMTPAIFEDLSVVSASSSSLTAKANRRGKTKVRTAPLTVSNNVATDKNKLSPEEVVGDDSNVDGKIDQKDNKRALLLAPWAWSSVLADPTDSIASILRSLPSYESRIDIKQNLDQSDSYVIIEDWQDFNRYDTIVITTMARDECDSPEGVPGFCEMWISSGIWIGLEDEPPPNSGLMPAYYYDPELDPGEQVEMKLGLDFWNIQYGGTLDKRLVTFTISETGNTTGSGLATAIGGDDFVMAGWTETVPIDISASAAVAFYQALSLGLAAHEAFDLITGLGLFPVTNDEGVETTFEIFSPRDHDVRLIELPRLMYQGNVMRDGIVISDLVTGTVGDSDPDRLKLTVQIDGVTAESKPEFKILYRVDDVDVPGVYDLDSATQVGGHEYRYEVQHDVELDSPLSSGDLPIEVIADLPEGGESRFSVTPTLPYCYFSADVSGDKAAFFDGPAQFQIDEDGSIDFRLRSRGAINADLSRTVSAGFSTNPGNPQTPGEYAIDSAGLNFSLPGYNAVYMPGEEGFDCPTCGGTVDIVTHNAEQSMSGSASVTMVRINPPPEEGQLPAVTLDVDFVAAFGSEFVGSSPYVVCSIQYSEEE